MTERDFKGVWISASIWLDDRLSAQETVILAEIDSLDNGEGCWASNEYLAKFSKCSVATVSRAIKNLKDLGFISVGSFDGRTRILKSRISNLTRQPNQIDKAESSNCTTIYIEDNVKDIVNTTKSKTTDFEAWKNAYNELCPSLPKCRALSQRRKTAIRSMMKQGVKIDDFKEACQKAETSDFLKGNNDRGWKATPDWMFNAENVLKVLEGKYQTKARQQTAYSLDVAYDVEDYPY